MREIKFRAWLEPQNVMEYGLFGLRSDGVPNFQSNVPNFKATLMQFTGLLDKNGKEIFEGDIVKNEAGDLDSIVFSKIGYDGSRCGLTGFAFSRNLRPELEFGYGRILGEFSELQYYDNPNKLEVIGNIYESPELQNK